MKNSRKKKVEKYLILSVLCGNFMWMAGCGKTVAQVIAEEKGTSVESEDILTDTNTKADSEIVSSTEKKMLDKNTVEFIMVGDILLHDKVEESGRQRDGSYNFDHLFKYTADRIQEADIALVNQEVILGGEELGISGYPTFNGPFEVGDALAKAGFDIVLHATNHAMDRGTEGIENCINFWETSHPELAYLGIHSSEESQNDIYIREVNGIKIAFLNYTFSTNGIEVPKDQTYLVDMLEEDKVIADLEAAETQADFTIVLPHWGSEYEHGTTEEQAYWSKIFLEYGADLCIGTHPHVIEPIRWEEDEEGNKMLVYYSIGNYVNATSGTGAGVADRMLGGMAKVTIGRNGDRTEIVAYDVEPLICHVAEGIGELTVYPIEDYTAELALENEIRDQDSTFSLKYCRNLVNQIWGDLKR